MVAAQPVAVGSRVVDGDGHLIERDAELFEYLEPPYRGNAALLGYPFFPTLDGWHRGAILARTGIHKEYTIDARTWVDFLDEVGIESTVLYPTAGLAFGCIQDPDWAVALARAYNNWVYDRFCRVDPRLRAVALVPLQDVAEASKELRRAIEDLRLVGVVLTGNNADLGVRKLLGDPAFWPVYEEAERLNCAVAIHGAVSMNLGLEAFHGFAAVQALEHPFAQMLQLTSMVLEGVFERFPRLRVAYLEAGTSWVPFMMDRLDRAYHAWSGRERREYSGWVRRSPSDYIKTGNLFFSCEGGEEGLRHAIERLGTSECLLFASDFPHETNAARAKHEIAELRERTDLSEQDKANILSGVGVRRFYQR
jgi:predicted TIM-barrel fold metal-dependent hydrolase